MNILVQKKSEEEMVFAASSSNSKLNGDLP